MKGRPRPLLDLLWAALWLFIFIAWIGLVTSAFIDIFSNADLSDGAVSMAQVRQPVIDMLQRSGLTDRLGDDAIFLEVDDAVEFYRAADGDTPGS